MKYLILFLALTSITAPAYADLYLRFGYIFDVEKFETDRDPLLSNPYTSIGYLSDTIIESPGTEGPKIAFFAEHGSNLFRNERYLGLNMIGFHITFK